MLTCLSHFSPDSDPKPVIENLMNTPEGKDIDEALVGEIKAVSGRDADEVDVLRGRLGDSRMRIKEYEALISELQGDLQILKRRSFKRTQGSKDSPVPMIPQVEASTTAPGGDADELKITIEDQRSEISALLQRCSSMEKEKETLAHVLRVIPPNFLDDTSRLSLVLNRYQEIEESNKTLNSLLERYKKDFDGMYAQSKSSIEDLKSNCIQDIGAQHEKMNSVREESGRLRQERDKMRTLYEESNSALSHANKKIQHLQKS